MKKSAILLSIILIICFTSCKEKIPAESGVKIMGYYYPHGPVIPGALNLDKLTHIIFSFTEVINNEMQFMDDSSGIKLKHLVDQKKEYPHLKVMIACGGWGGSGGFSDMARNADSRRKFVTSVNRFLRDYNLDGLDIDWEYPGLPGDGNPYIPEDKQNFTSLMKELRASMDSISTEQILTFAVAGWQDFFYNIELDKVMPHVTYMNVMSYDLAGGNDPYTSHHTNLGWVKMEDIEGTPAAMKMIEDGDSTKPWSAERIISYCMGKGVKASQIIIGSGFYGKGWIGVPPVNNGLYQLNRGPWRGRGNYFIIREQYEDKNGWVRTWDPIAKAPWLYNAADSIFLSYEDTVSVRLKTQYAANTGLAGIMFWSLTGDAEKDGLVDAIYAEKGRQVERMNKVKKK